MIIDFSNINGGGGGGGYVLPTATDTRLGGVKIGDGIDVDSAGTISVSGSDVANYAMALKNIQEDDGNNYNIVNESGWLYYVEDSKDNESEDIFVKVKYTAEYVNIDMDIDGQTDTDIIEIGDLFKVSIDSEGNLFYVNENEEAVYYDSEVSEYQYGDFTFIWSNDGKYIGFSQQSNWVEVIVYTQNFEILRCVGKEIFIANEDQLGLVKVGDGLDVAEDGTISVTGGTGGGVEVVDELPLGDEVILYFTDNDGSSQCDFEIKNYDYSTEQDTYWVHFHSSTNGDLYVYIDVEGNVDIDTEDWTGTVPELDGLTTAYTLTFSSSADYDTSENLLGNIRTNKRPEGYEDGATVLLDELIPEKIIDITGTGNGSADCVMTAIGLTNKTRFITFNFYLTNVDVYIDQDNTLELYDSFTQASETFAVGTSGETYTMNGQPQTNVLTLYVTESGATIKFQGSTNRSNAISPIHQHSEERQVLYTWSDGDELTADIDYTTSTDAPWCVRWKYTELPKDDITLLVCKYKYGNDYYFYRIESGRFYLHKGSTPTVWDSARYEIPQYQHQRVTTYGFSNYSYVYWTEDEIVIYSTENTVRMSFAIDEFYRNGWHKETEHKIDTKAFYKNYVWYDGDFQPIIQYYDFNLYQNQLRINPTSQYQTAGYVWGPNNTTFGPIFAPATTAATADQLCVSAQGWGAPSWKTMLALLGIKRVWRGTEDDYDAIGTGNYDGDTLYVIVEE